MSTELSVTLLCSSLLMGFLYYRLFIYNHWEATVKRIEKFDRYHNIPIPRSRPSFDDRRTSIYEAIK